MLRAEGTHGRARLPDGQLRTAPLQESFYCAGLAEFERLCGLRAQLRQQRCSPLRPFIIIIAICRGLQPLGRRAAQECVLDA
eukprot:5842012-Prymnesium_polylepis.1